MIHARDVTKEYLDGDGTRVRVLDGMTLDVEAGDFVAVVGPSGSGKSTLLHLLGGLDVDYRGEVKVGGVTLGGLKDKDLARFRNTHVGFVFQSFHLIPNLSALENVLLPSYFGPRTPDAIKRAEALLERVGLGAKKDRAPVRLSGGERQRVAIARALYGGPRLLLCDEPTGNLDATTGDGVIQLFRELHREGLTVLAVTHEERMSAAARRVLRLKEGKLVEEPAPERATLGGAP
ncbi:ABC transporter ATP-binding protein [Myxococcus llanfairpwllgwyngyllgogerychwyrndrobwllllantysiliogogogochensis]|uniref:ABC transporter ATP-binding protein n=1 Tax=Myxococcus llanfairpwllgwyngyllgogerychwyrndrobwllllantysiliogogogochensis TaxID=2590453 RepID=A0A540WLY8_9BACT|nr:ABC transporter ATP-binding protein [Myxococcus llanfairpwllgwyngyllgogerychwyrndrobwllllantysiliogogogochensis]NTX00674.1 ABC transporter ATP-binding protein [Myxococcus sp. CA040A]TQF10028.1 ABC transporter ATP-binding protein [Myxococcus llanfairpwllgwyngyllgogerychwyrndrobwllllantysiliogogogochensis]